MPDELLQRLRRFHEHSFPLYRAGPGELFMVRNVGALVPPCCGTRDGGLHDIRSGSFVPASKADHSGTGPVDTAMFNEIDASLAPG